MDYYSEYQLEQSLIWSMPSMIRTYKRYALKLVPSLTKTQTYRYWFYVRQWHSMKFLAECQSVTHWLRAIRIPCQVENTKKLTVATPKTICSLILCGRSWNESWGSDFKIWISVVFLKLSWPVPRLCRKPSPWFHHVCFHIRTAFKITETATQYIQPVFQINPKFNIKPNYVL
jgi:hypothetical protein